MAKGLLTLTCVCLTCNLLCPLFCFQAFAPDFENMAVKICSHSATRASVRSSSNVWRWEEASIWSSLKGLRSKICSPVQLFHTKQRRNIIVHIPLFVCMMGEAPTASDQKCTEVNGQECLHTFGHIIDNKWREMEQHKLMLLTKLKPFLYVTFCFESHPHFT